VLLLVNASCVTMGDAKKNNDELKTSMEELRLSAANNTQALEELKAENEKLKGEIEKLNFTIKQREESFDVRLLALEAKMNADAKVLAKNEEVAAPSQDILSIDIDKRYKAARKFHEDSNFDEAERYYRSIIGCPSKWYEEKAMYYLGLMYYDKKEHERSVVTLQDFVDKYPSSKNLPSAIYVQGESLSAMNKAEEAKLFFEDLVNRFPNSKEARDAKKRLKK